MPKPRPIIPERVQLELVFGCNADCIMCPVHSPTKRKKGTMELDLFKKICDGLFPYRRYIKKFDMWGLGESLLDKALFEKIRYAKHMGFQSIALATNADLLNEDKQKNLLESGIDAIIFSIDGYLKETHERIRRKTNFIRVTENAESIIKRRNKDNFKTRFIFRFIRQEANKLEWGKFKSYWLKKISPDKKDIIIGYDAHTWGGEKSIFRKDVQKRNVEIEKKPCHHIFDRLIVFWDGKVPLCCSDLHHGEYALGSVNDYSPIDIFNNKKINKIRKIHLSGKKNNMKICKECTILYSENVQEVID